MYLLYIKKDNKYNRIFNIYIHIHIRLIYYTYVLHKSSIYVCNNKSHRKRNVRLIKRQKLTLLSRHAPENVCESRRFLFDIFLIFY